MKLALDCFAEPVLGPRRARTRGLAMTRALAVYLSLRGAGATKQSRPPQPLLALEHRFAFFHEGGAAFGVILARKAFLDEPLAESEVALAFIFHRLTHDGFNRPDRQRRIGGDQLAVVLDTDFQLVGRHELVDEADPQGLLGAELPRRIENLARASGTYQIDQPTNPVIGIAEPELGRRNAETRALGGNPHVARQRRTDAAADAIALDHRDRRLRRVLEPLPGTLGDLAVGRRSFRRGALFLEFGDVGAGHKSATASAADHDDADCVVLLKIVDDPAHRLPHFERDRVVPRRVVEDQPANTAVFLHDHFARDRLVEHFSRSSQ